MRFFPETLEEFRTGAAEGRRFDFAPEFSDLGVAIGPLVRAGYPLQLGIVAPDRGGWNIPVAVFGRATAMERIVVVSTGERFLDEDLACAGELWRLRPEAATLLSLYGFSQPEEYTSGLAAAVVDDSATRTFLVPRLSDQTRENLARGFALAAESGRNHTVHIIHDASQADPSDIAASIAELARSDDSAAAAHRLAQRARVAGATPMDQRNSRMNK